MLNELISDIAKEIAGIKIVASTHEFLFFTASREENLIRNVFSGIGTIESFGKEDCYSQGFQYFGAISGSRN